MQFADCARPPVGPIGISETWMTKQSVEQIELSLSLHGRNGKKGIRSLQFRNSNLYSRLGAGSDKILRFGFVNSGDSDTGVASDTGLLETRQAYGATCIHVTNYPLSCVLTNYNGAFRPWQHFCPPRSGAIGR